MVVVGSGPASHAAAIACRQVGLTVVTLCRDDSGKNRFGEHLAPEAAQPLAELDLNGLLNATDHLQSAGILSHWGGPQSAEQDYIFSPFGNGWNLDRHCFDKALLRAAQNRGARVLYVRHIQGLTRLDGKWRVTFAVESGTSEIETSFVMDATGRSTSVARSLGFMPVRLDRLVGLFGWIPIRSRDPAGPDTRLVIEPMFDGWWYSLRLPKRRMIAVYMTDADLHAGGAKALRRIWEDRFTASVTSMARIEGEGSPRGFRVANAASQCLTTMAGEGWLAIGDASMAFDPLAAAGLTKALCDGVDAAKAIAAARNGRQSAIDGYARDRLLAFNDYVRQRRWYYNLERRWRDHPFWHRRQLSR